MYLGGCICSIQYNSLKNSVHQNVVAPWLLSMSCREHFNVIIILNRIVVTGEAQRSPFSQDVVFVFFNDCIF